MPPKPFHLMPGPKLWPIFGNSLDYSPFGRHTFERLHRAKKQNAETYGQIYRERLGRDIVQLYDPADIERVLRADGRFPLRLPLPLPVVAHRRDGEPLGLGMLNGEDWWNQRRVVHRCMMHPRAATVYINTQNAVADDMLSLIDCLLHQTPTDGSASSSSIGTGSTDHPEGAEIEDLIPVLTKYAMEAFGSVCFGVRLGLLGADLTDDSVAHRMHVSTSRMFEAVQKTTFSFPWYSLFRTELYTQFVESSRICHGIAKSYVKEAMRNNKTCAVAPSAECDRNQPPNFLRTLLTNDYVGQLSLDELVGLAVELFTAGIDSTAYATAFCLYNLARNPDKQSKLAAELDRVLPPAASPTACPPVTEEALADLSYLKACVKESFRLNFPVEGGTTRQITKDLELGGYLVPKGILVSFNNQTMCRQERYFEHADTYWPERWLKNGANTLRPAPSFVMLPFGYGPRMCIGRRFAEQEIFLAVCKIIQRYRLEYRYPNDIGMINRVFTMPDAPLRLTFIPRSTQHQHQQKQQPQQPIRS